MTESRNTIYHFKCLLTKTREETFKRKTKKRKLGKANRNLFGDLTGIRNCRITAK